MARATIHTPGLFLSLDKRVPIHTVDREWITVSGDRRIRFVGPQLGVKEMRILHALVAAAGPQCAAAGRADPIGDPTRSTSVSCELVLMALLIADQAEQLHANLAACSSSIERRRGQRTGVCDGTTSMASFCPRELGRRGDGEETAKCCEHVAQHTPAGGVHVAGVLGSSCSSVCPFTAARAGDRDSAAPRSPTST